MKEDQNLVFHFTGRHNTVFAVAIGNRKLPREREREREREK
jgi:hypothetical protein